VAHGRVEAGAAEPGGARRHRAAAVLEREHGHAEALAFRADAVLHGHLDVLHREAAGVAGQDAPLLLDAVGAESLERALHDEGAEARVVAVLLLLLVRPG